MRRRIVVGLVASVLVFAGCDEYNDERGRGDAPVGSTNDDPAIVINFPDKFHNVAFKCLGVNGIYTHTREAPPIVVPNDPNCNADSEEQVG